MRRDLQDIRSFFHAKTSEETQFDDLRLSSIHLFEPFQRIIQRDQFTAMVRTDISRISHVSSSRIADVFYSAYSPSRGSCARRVHKNSPHDLGRNTEETCSVPQRRFLGIDQPKIGFV